MTKQELSQILYALKLVFGDDGIEIFNKILELLK